MRVGGDVPGLTVLALAVWMALAGPAVAQSGGGKSRQGPGGPGTGGEVETWFPSGPVFPRGQQSFEEPDLGATVFCFAGWETLARGSDTFLVSVVNDVLGTVAPRTVGSALERAAEAEPGMVTPGPPSYQWLRVRDLSSTDTTHTFCTAPVEPPVPWNYSWHFFVNLESLPGAGPAHPALMVQHGGPGGFEDAFGVEFARAGARLIVRGLGGDPVRVPLFAYGGASAPGQWIGLELAVNFDRGVVSASVNGAPERSLPIHPRRGTDLGRFRFAYRGEGPGNALGLLLDDLGVAFSSGVCEEVLALDFETEDDLVTPLVNGQDLSTPPEFGGTFAISGAGRNRGPAIFDSTQGGPNDPSQDLDLLVNLGNLVILQNDQVVTQTVPGIFDDPNDDQDGGTVFFSFTTPLEPLAIDLVDIDQGSVQRASVTLADRAGKTRVYSVPAGWTGDRVVNGPPGFATLDLTTLLPQPGLMSTATAVEDAGFDSGAVVMLAVQFGSSGGLDNLELRVPCVTLDFETEDDATTPLANGQDLSTPPEFGRDVALASSGPNAGAGIFDSTPGGPNDPSQDRDLLVGLGNLLILQNDQAATQTVPGIFDRPNDDENGGALILDFLMPVSPRKLDLVDIDPGISNDSTVVLTDSGGRRRTFTVPGGFTEDLLANGPPGFRTLDLRNLSPQPGFQKSATAVQDAGFDEGAVLQIQVNLGSSGAVDNLCFCP